MNQVLQPRYHLTYMQLEAMERKAPQLTPSQLDYSIHNYSVHSHNAFLDKHLDVSKEIIISLNINTLRASDASVCIHSYI